jgi:hypothetical protein
VGDPAGVGGLDDPDLAALAAQRDARIGRDRGRRGQARHNLERDPGLGVTERVRGAAVEQRIAIVEPDHQLTGPGRRGQIGFAGLQAVEHDQLGTGGDQLAGPRPGLTPGDHQVGLAE